jgi:hypothetical protein
MVEVVGATDHRYSTYKYYHYALTVSMSSTHATHTIKPAAALRHRRLIRSYLISTTAPTSSSLAFSSSAAA